MITKYYDTDCNLGLLDGKTVSLEEKDIWFLKDFAIK